jgi:hypothetical protein
MKEVFICYSNIFRQKDNLLSIYNTYKFFKILETDYQIKKISFPINIYKEKNSSNRNLKISLKVILYVYIFKEMS